jgi:hypothetical protein
LLGKVFRSVRVVRDDPFLSKSSPARQKQIIGFAYICTLHTVCVLGAASPARSAEITPKLWGYCCISDFDKGYTFVICYIYVCMYEEFSIEIDRNAFLFPFSSLHNEISFFIRLYFPRRYRKEECTVKGKQRNQHK